MAKMTLEDLRRMREAKQKAMEMRDSANKDIQVIVGMGTCGIAAGARPVLNTLVEEVNRLLRQYEQMKKMFKQMNTKGGKKKLMRQFGGMGGFPGF